MGRHGKIGNLPIFQGAARIWLTLLPYMRQGLLWLRWLLLGGAVLGFAAGCVFQQSSLLLLGSLLLLLHNVLFSLRVFRARFLFFLFHAALFVFLLARPFIGLLQGYDWVGVQIQDYAATESSVALTLRCLFVSMLCLWLGALAGEFCQDRVAGRAGKRKKATHTKLVAGFSGAQWEESLRRVSFGLLCVSFLFVMLREIEKAAFMLSNSYVAYYSEFSTAFPYPVYVVSTFFAYSIFLYLAALPKKKNAYFALVLYVLTALPTFLGGERGGLVLHVLVAITYFVFRDASEGGSRWVGRFERTALCLGVPLGILLLGAMNYLRRGAWPELGIWGLAKDFFYKQGVTFSWTCGGMAAMPLLRSQGVRSYTFGAVIDYLLHGSLAQKLFHASSLGTGNSLVMATQSSAMEHHLSYLLLGPEKYLSGRGTGSCYLLELFADAGLPGVILFSLLLGAFLVVAFRLAQKSALLRMAVLCSLSGLLFIPRGNALGGLEFLWRIAFWCTMTLCFGGALLDLFLRRLRKKRHVGAPPVSGA